MWRLCEVGQLTFALIRNSVQLTYEHGFSRHSSMLQCFSWLLLVAGCIQDRLGQVMEFGLPS